MAAKSIVRSERGFLAVAVNCGSAAACTADTFESGVKLGRDRLLYEILCRELQRYACGVVRL